jgi:nitrate/nitrite transporter NarK
MAVSWRIVIFLLALTVFGVFWGIGNEVVQIIEPIITTTMGTERGTQLLTWTSRIWALSPVFALIALAAWLFKQGVILQR